MARPSEYDSKYCEEIIDLMAQGYSIEACAGSLGVSKQTIYNWCDAHPEFMDAKRIGESKGQFYWEGLGIKNILNISSGDRFSGTESVSLNSTVWVFNMKNRFGWRDKTEIVGDEAKPIQIAYVPRSKKGEGGMSVTFSTFNPAIIAWQDQVVDEVETQYDYSEGYHEAMYSGSVGSAKTTLLAHQIVKHCLMFKKAHVGIGRRTLPDLKGTLYQAILDHLDQDDLRNLYKSSDTRAIIKFTNGSVIRGISWADRRYKKVRSYEFSMVVIEEGTENDDEDKTIYDELCMRLRRQVVIENQPDEEEDPGFDQALGKLLVRPDISKGAPRLMIVATNPDSPAHWLYQHFIAATSERRHVYYSLTADNPFLPNGYLEQLRATLDPKMARRMLFGEWLDIRSEVVYHAYNPDVHFLKTQEYKVDEQLPIKFSLDFNIGTGKPMSAVFEQYDPATDTFHAFNEAVIDGARTESLLEDVAARGLLDYRTMYHIHGDATGAARSTNSIHSDYDLIKKFLSNYKTKTGEAIRYQMLVPMANPPVRTRHNVVNAYLMNDLKQVRTKIYGKCPVLAQGMMLTALKKGADYIEDDSKKYQHVTTAHGYLVVYTMNAKNVGQIRTY